MGVLPVCRWALRSIVQSRGNEPAVCMTSLTGPTPLIIISKVAGYDDAGITFLQGNIIPPPPLCVFPPAGKVNQGKTK